MTQQDMQKGDNYATTALTDILKRLDQVENAIKQLGYELQHFKHSQRNKSREIEGGRE